MGSVRPPRLPGHSGGPSRSFRRRPESRGPDSRIPVARLPGCRHSKRRPESQRAPAPRFVMSGPPTRHSGAPSVVIPAKAGIQRRPPTEVIPAKAGIQGIGGQAGLPRAPAPRFVMPFLPDSSFRRPTSSFRRRPASQERRRGAWQGFQGIGGQAGLPRAPAPRFVIPAPPLRHSGEGRNPEGR